LTPLSAGISVVVMRCLLDVMTVFIRSTDLPIGRGTWVR
jgi:hypothetical protein